MAWFFRLNTLPNTTQFSTFSYFLLQYYFSSLDTYYFSFLTIFSCLFLTMSSVSSIFTLHTFKFYPSPSTFLHLSFAFLLVRNFCVFLLVPVQQCLFSSFESQISQYDFFLAVQVPLFISFLFIFFFFPFEVFWFTEYKFFLVLRTIFFLSINFMPVKSWISAGIYWNTRNRLK